MISSKIKNKIKYVNFINYSVNSPSHLQLASKQIRFHYIKAKDIENVKK
jgi:hypothetical protein